MSKGKGNQTSKLTLAASLAVSLGAWGGFISHNKGWFRESARIAGVAGTAVAVDRAFGAPITGGAGADFQQTQGFPLHRLDGRVNQNRSFTGNYPAGTDLAGRLKLRLNGLPRPLWESANDAAVEEADVDTNDNEWPAEVAHGDIRNSVEDPRQSSEKATSGVRWEWITVAAILLLLVAWSFRTSFPGKR